MEERRCSSMLSVAVIKHSGKKQLREASINLVYTSSSHSIIKGNQSWTVCKKWSRNHEKLLLSWSIYDSCQAWVQIQPSSTCPGIVSPTGSWPLPHHLAIKKMPTYLSIGQLDLHNSSTEAHSSQVTRLCQAAIIKSNQTRQQHHCPLPTEASPQHSSLRQENSPSICHSSFKL